MDFMAMKRSQLYGMANNPYSTAQQAGGGPYPPSQPYTSAPSHRYPMGMQGRGQMGMGGMQYPQQQVFHRTTRGSAALGAFVTGRVFRLVPFEAHPKIPGLLTPRPVVVSALFICEDFLFPRMRGGGREVGGC